MCEIIHVEYFDNKGKRLPDDMQAIPINISAAKSYDAARYIRPDSVIEKPLPILYENRDECCGCTACYSVCPLSGPERNMTLAPKLYGKIWTGDFTGTIKEVELTGAITMLPDSEGFLYPVVDGKICIRCYKCLNICGFKKKQ